MSDKMEIIQTVAPFWPLTDNDAQQQYLDNSVRYYDYNVIQTNEGNAAIQDSAVSSWTFNLFSTESYKVLSDATLDLKVEVTRATDGVAGNYLQLVDPLYLFTSFRLLFGTLPSKRSTTLSGMRLIWSN